MANFSRQDAEALNRVLQNAAIQCSERCLYQSAKWIAELASSLSSHLEEEENDDETDIIGSQESALRSTTYSPTSDPKEARLESREFQRYMLAKSYFDCREFERCAAVFLPSGLPKSPLSSGSPATKLKSPRRAPHGKGKSLPMGSLFPESTSPTDLPRLSQKALFLALYAKYMSGEKAKDEEAEMILGPTDQGAAINKELVAITHGLEMYFSSRVPEDYSGGWLEYLYGIVLAKGKNEDDSKRWLLRSVLISPYNWGAWLELSSLIGTVDELHQLFTELQPNVMALLFNIYANQELYQASEQIHRQLSDLEQVFPNCAFLQTQKGLLFYHSKEFEDAESVFSQILTADPHRIDSLDHYSNILYVMGARAKLAFVAQIAIATDKFRPETCCVVGNYYSLKSEHEKAVQYFRRALLLDRTFLSAWTLMGHEYVEMKNTHAAIESYRRAVDVNRKDYRAWYGLGQTYEVLEMDLYALFYYQRAAALRPHDSKMWHAVASCYDRVGRPAQAIKAYKRALVAGSLHDAGTASFASAVGGGAAGPDGYVVAETLCNIATLYERLGERERTAEYMEMTLAQEEGFAMVAEEGGGSSELDDEVKASGIGVTAVTSKARIWLARWEAGRGGWKRALELAHELREDGVELEEAGALIKDIRDRMDDAE